MWHYQKDGKGCGPVNRAELAALLRGGALPPNTQVWTEGMNAWMAANQLAEFQPDLAAATPSGVPPQMPTNDAEQHKIYGIISYLVIFWVVGLLVAPRSRFVRFHANQGIVLFITMLLVGASGRVFHMLPFVGPFLGWGTQLLELGCFILMVIGIVNAARGECQRLPVIGGFDVLK